MFQLEEKEYFLSIISNLSIPDVSFSICITTDKFFIFLLLQVHSLCRMPASPFLLFDDVALIMNVISK